VPAAFEHAPERVDVRAEVRRGVDKRKANSRLRGEVDDAVEALSSLMEPMIMVVLGTLIGGMVIAMYLPIFKMGQAV